MHSAEAATPAPTYGDSGELEEALDGPVLAERAVEDRQHDVDLADRARRRRVREDGKRLDGFRRHPGGACPRRRASSVRRGRSRSSSSRSAPGSSAAATERAGRGDLVLARAPAREDRHAQARAHGVGVVSFSSSCR